VSIIALETAIYAQTNVCAAVVSERLFFKLDGHNRLKVEQRRVGLQSALLGDGPIRRFFRHLLQKTQEPITFTVFVLEGATRVRVELATLWDFQLDDDGPNSFVLAHW
jgi:hypothetical protein